MKKTIVMIRLNPLIDEWFKEEANRKQMHKSEFMRKVLTEFKEKEEKNDGTNG
jgi:hypothetical protein